MTSGVNRLNRALLVLLGLLLSVGAAVGLALGAGAFGVPNSRRQLLETHVSGYADRTPWFWWAVAAGSLVLALLSLSWLLVQARTDRIRRIDLAPGDSDGATVVQAGAVTEAVEQEVGSFTGVTAASARLRGNRGRRLDLIVGVNKAADLTQLRDRLQQQSVANLRRVLDAPDLPVEIKLRLTANGRAPLL